MKDKDLCAGCLIIDSLCPGLGNCDKINIENYLKEKSISVDDAINLLKKSFQIPESEKTDITDNQMEEALNILIEGCGQRNCSTCVMDSKCTYLFDIARNFKSMKDKK